MPIMVQWLSSWKRTLSVVGLGLLASLVLGACGRAPQLSGATPSPDTTLTPIAAASPSPAPSASASPAPTPSPVSTADWVTYADPALGYSLMMPPGWYDVSASTPGSDQLKDFANEKVGAPLLMDSSGVWLHLSVSSSNGSACTLWNLRSGATNPKTLAIGGIQVTRYAVDSTEGYLVVANVQNGHCYNLSFFYINSATRDAGLDVDDTILGTFKFGSPP